MAKNWESWHLWVANKPLECSCGARFRSRFKIGRHRQKWNSRSDLRRQRLVR